MAIAILGDVDAADAARVRAFAADALAELGAASLEVPVKVVAEGEGSAGWATSSGVYICADQLDESDDELRWVVAEEVAHFWFLREHGDDGDDFHHEAFATWFVCAHCDVEWKPDAIDEADSYQLGRLVGGASAGLPAARQALDRVSPTLRVLDLVDRLDGIDDPQAFARELADYHDSPVTRLAARLEARGYEPHLAAAAAKASAKKLGREHPAWARAAGRPEDAAVLDALAGLEAAGRWRDEHVSGFGGNRGGVPPDLLLDAATPGWRPRTTGPATRSPRRRPASDPHIPREGRRLIHDAMDDAEPSFNLAPVQIPGTPYARRGASQRPAPRQAVLRRRP
jgi:hypothetical protein